MKNEYFKLCLPNGKKWERFNTLTGAITSYDKYIVSIKDMSKAEMDKIKAQCKIIKYVETSENVKFTK